ncbi:MAG: hypothetical protein GX654_00580 [Desulfatiglans sp.]|jgi:hypothetical protein|nr:hypothetical protein [Desulfatiglans sp.]
MLSDNELLRKLHDRTEELHKRMDMQCAMMESLINRGFKKDGASSALSPQSVEREKRLADALKDTIDVLEETKKSFKSKRLEMLRKRLTDVLIE